MKVGLSLSGGAARGMIHIGAMEELENANIPIDMIAGSSIGAFIGALYALNPNIQEVRKQIFKFLDEADHPLIPIELADKTADGERRSIFKRIALNLRKTVYYGISLTQSSVISGESLRELLGRLIPDVDFAELKLPFACAATDITNNKVYYFTEGSLLDAVTASCSIPGFFPPVSVDGMSLVDGDWAAHCHADKLREMGAGYVIAVDIQQGIKEEPESMSGLDIVIRSHMATRKALSDIQLAQADIVIQPDTCEINWWDFEESETCLLKGKSQTADQIKDIKQQLRNAKLKRMFSFK